MRYNIVDYEVKFFIAVACSLSFVTTQTLLLLDIVTPKDINFLLLTKDVSYHKPVFRQVSINVLISYCIQDANWIGRKAMFLQRNIRRSKRHQSSHAARLAAANGCVPPVPPPPNGSGGSPLANPSPPQLLDAAARPATEHYVNEDRTECKFDANSYQMVFVVNKEQYLYVRDSLEKARKVGSSFFIAFFPHRY